MSLWYVYPVSRLTCGVTIGKAVVFVAFDLKRRIAIRRKLQRISKVHKTLGKGDVPKVG
jgi:hypothetical protein